MKKLIFVTGEKGGVMKSFLSKLTASVLLDDGKKTLCIEADMRNPDFYNFARKDTRAIEVAIKKKDGWFDLINEISKCEEEYIVVSTPAGVGENLENEYDLLFEACQQLNVEVHFIWCMSKVRDCIVLLKRFTDFIAGRDYKLTVAKSGFFGEESSFIRWNDSKTRKAVAKQGANEIYISELYPSIVDTIDDSMILFNRALQSNDLELAQKMQFRIWYRDNAEKVRGVIYG
ncbi:hypothetical protein [Endozoicomonas ascidiicola]|uniref:hypothetical protein n=1 Tax=Endozoicomonas ascidiicola TaxID=1698521 RepID=UPI000830A8FF|nr:hypothetical protein [Endozoicomonas ascidiicola]